MVESPSTRASLVVRLRDPKDERAWEEFVEIYSPLIVQLARRRGLQDADRADLAQDVFRAVARAIDQYDPDPARGSFRAWLFRIARNLMVNLLAKQARQPRGTGDGDMMKLLEQQPAPDGEESVLFEGEYRRRLFAWAADRVRQEFRETTWQAFWRAGVDGEDPKVIAQALRISVGAVYIAKSRVMSRLRREIDVVQGDEC
jgi:RNA polymerase sigma factor (sigma-70 family)